MHARSFGHLATLTIGTDASHCALLSCCSSSSIRSCSGSITERTSSAVYRGVMYFGQFHENATTSTVITPSARPSKPSDASSSAVGDGSK